MVFSCVAHGYEKHGKEDVARWWEEGEVIRMVFMVHSKAVYSSFLISATPVHPSFCLHPKDGNSSVGYDENSIPRNIFSEPLGVHKEGPCSSKHLKAPRRYCEELN